MSLPLCTRACHLCTRCVYSLHWVHVSAHSACPLGRGRCPLSTEVRVTCGQGFCPLCTQRIAALHRAHILSAWGTCPSCTWCVSVPRGVTDIPHPPEIHTQPEKAEVNAAPWAAAGLLVWECTQKGSMVLSNHRSKLSWAFLRGLDKAHQPLLGSSKGSPHPPTPQAESTSCFVKSAFFKAENTPEGTREPLPPSLRVATGKGRYIPDQLLTRVPAPTRLVLWLSSSQMSGKGTKAEALCQPGVQAERGAGRAGWHRQGAEACAHVPGWHAAGNGERLMPGALPERGNPIHARLCFWGRMRAPAVAGVAALFHAAPAAEPCQSSFPAKHLPMGLFFKKHLGQGRPLKPISSTTPLLQQAVLGGCLGKDTLMQ